jgi:hypothetical protein
MRALALAVLLLPALGHADEKRDDAAAEMAKGDDAFMNQHDNQTAIAHYNAARLLAPDRPGPYLALGQVYQATGDCKQATAMMQKYLQLKTTDAKPDAQKVIDDCKAKVCPPGMIKNADTQDHCCWQGQVWVVSENRCVGTPVCPKGYAIGPHGKGCIATGNCPPGKVVSQDPKQCCWPGQGYSHEKKACVGAPVCPQGMTANGDNCQPGIAAAAPGAPAPAPAPGGAGKLLNREQIRVTMLTRVRPMVMGCNRQYHTTGNVQINFGVQADGIVQRAQVLPPFAGTQFAACLEDSLRSAAFPPHTGGMQNITWNFNLR